MILNDNTVVKVHMGELEKVKAVLRAVHTGVVYHVVAVS